MNRDYYTFEGLESLLNYYNEIDENMEFDCIAICCDCTEYGKGAAFRGGWWCFFLLYANFNLYRIDAQHKKDKNL